MHLTPRLEHLHTFWCLWRHPTASRDGLIEFQGKKLRKLIAHAYTNVTYYRELFHRAGLKPEDIQSVKDLRLIPVTSKDDLRMRTLAEVLAKGADPGELVSLKTSGSSGKPFTVRRSHFEEHLLNMFRIRARAQIGVRIFDRIAQVLEPPLGGRKQGLPGRLRQTLGLYRTYQVNGLEGSENIIGELESLKPDVIIGYPSSLGLAASYITGASVPGIRPRLIITGGEVLHPGMKDFIERVFCTPVFDMYGAHEFNLLAWECPEKEIYHVCDDSVILEILRDGKPVAVGEKGEVVATALHSYIMPFIRYQTGDIATKGPDTCRCGQPFSTLAGIEGRTVDYFRLPGNRYVHPYEITGPLIDHEGHWVFQHQLIEESEQRITLKIAPLRKPQKEELERLKRLGEERLGPGVEFAIELVEGFIQEPGKKFHPYICLLNRNTVEGDGPND